jgi:hypothetical protein
MIDYDPLLSVANYPEKITELPARESKIEGGEAFPL